MTSVLDADGSLSWGGPVASIPPILLATPQRDRGGAVITLDGEIDISSAGQIRDAVAECLRRPAPTSLLIDLSAVTFCDCAGIAALEWAHGKARTGRMHFTLRGVDKRLRRVFTLAHAYGLLEACRPLRVAN
jgi:anti-anti-sigma factor